MSTVRDVIKKYQEILSPSLEFSFSNNRPTLGKEGIANRLFVLKLGDDKTILVEFLQEAKLIQTEMTCEKHKESMEIVGRTFVSDGFVWLCRFPKCGVTRSLRTSSWLGKTRLKFNEMLFLIYELVRGTRTKDIESEYSFSTGTLADWRQFIRDEYSNYLVSKSEMIGGTDKVVELGEVKFGKCTKGKAKVEEVYFLGGLEQGSGKVFLVPCEDNSSELWIGAIEEWVLPGSTVRSYFWNTKASLGDEGFDYLTRNNNITFDPTCHFKKCSVPWHTQHQNEFLVYLFNKHCKENNVDKFNKFLEIIAVTNFKPASD